jgi:hypothetical protein
VTLADGLGRTFSQATLQYRKGRIFQNPNGVYRGTPHQISNLGTSIAVKEQ